jgi:toxin-antitoxin system PIN domain toxin
VIIPDLNLLLYAYDAQSPHHRVAAAWWESCVNGSEPVGLPAVVLFGFLRLATSSRVFASPMSIEQVADCVREWMSRPHIIEASGGLELFPKVIELIRHAGTAGHLVTDAQIAATAIEHGATLFTNDSDFSRLPGLKVVNPLTK